MSSKFRVAKRNSILLPTIWARVLLIGPGPTVGFFDPGPTPWKSHDGTPELSGMVCTKIAEARGVRLDQGLIEHRQVRRVR